MARAQSGEAWYTCQSHVILSTVHFSTANSASRLQSSESANSDAIVAEVFTRLDRVVWAGSRFFHAPCLWLMFFRRSFCG